MAIVIFLLWIGLTITFGVAFTCWWFASFWMDWCRASEGRRLDTDWLLEEIRTNRHGYRRSAQACLYGGWISVISAILWLIVSRGIPAE